MVSDALVLLVVGIGSQAQGPIVDETSTAEGTAQDVSLLIGGVEAVLVRSFLFHVSHCITYHVKHQLFASADAFFPPWIERPGFPEWSLYEAIRLLIIGT